MTVAGLEAAPRQALKKFALPIAFLAIGVAVTLVLFMLARHAVDGDARERFERQANDARHIFQTRLRSYVDVTYALKALHDSRGALSRREFHDYVESLDLDRRYPGFEVLNFARHIKGSQKQALEAEVRRDASLDPRGYPGFAVKPPGERPEHHVLIYLEPMQGNEFAFGLDIGVGAAQARAQASARDSGELTSSGRLIRHAGRVQFVGLSVRLPVYRKDAPMQTVEDRRAAFAGTVGAGFNVRTLLTGMLDQTTMKPMRYRLYDVGPATRPPAAEDKPTLLFDSAQREQVPPNDNVVVPDSGAYFSARLPLQLGGRRWELQFNAPKSGLIEDSDSSFPWTVLIGGLLSSGLLFAVLYSLASSRERAMGLARSITRDLRESEANLAQAQNMARLGRWTLDRNSGEMTFSAEAAGILELGAESQTLDYRQFLSWLKASDRAGIEEAIAESSADGVSRSKEYRLYLPSGAPTWAYFIFEPNASPGPREREGRVREPGSMRGIIMDVTERKRVSLRLQLENSVTHLLSSGDEPETILTRVMQTACATFDWECGRLWQFETRDAQLHCTNSWSGGQPGVAGFFSFSEKTAPITSPSAVSRAYVQRAPVLIADLAVDDEAGRPHPALRAGLRGCVIMPVHSSGQIFGVLEFFSVYPHYSDPTFPAYLESIGSQIGQFFQRKQAEDRLRFVAAHDALTELPNRTTFADALQRSMRRAARQRSGVALLFIDIDRFKLVNDTLGHDAGDLILRECASRLTAALRDSDLIARLGGDEFVVLLESLNSPSDATAVARKIHDSFATPFMVSGQEFQLSASIGICTYPEDGEDAVNLLKNADVAMYRAKELGRNNYQFYAAQMNQHSFERLALESSLRRAVERGELMLHYQPKISLSSGNLSGMEALVRWRHPELGMVQPAQFIPLAEEIGLIVPIGEWVLREACRQCRAWLDDGYPPIRIAVNLSARQFAHSTLAHDVRAILAETGLRADCLELEITESMVMTQAENSIRILRELKDMGIHLAIDDFGTGYSSLAYLKRFPIDSIKIDRSFVRDLPEDPDDAAITRGIIALSHSLRLKVIAEGVENMEQKMFLAAAGCDELQGYLISKPVSAAQAGALLEQYARTALPVEPRKLA